MNVERHFMSRENRKDMKRARGFFEHINTVEPYSIAWFYAIETNPELVKRFCDIAKECIDRTLKEGS